MESRVDVVQRNLDACLEDLRVGVAALADDEPLAAGSRLTAAAARDLFTDQVRSRALDVAARELKASGRSFYTISSAGHEQNAVVGALLRTTDPCFLHYRAGGFMMARSRLAGDVDPVMDTLLSLVASADDPIAQGRHKVWGSRPLWVPPQTSTIASHLPKAVGTAFCLARMRRLGVPRPIPDDSIVCATFGDASVNHATALSGINAARYAHRRGNPMPILFVCEDNGIGISVDTPRSWIADSFSTMSNLRYIHADGELDELYETVAAAIERCRTARAPVFLHLPTVRLWGHAGSDVETTYRTLADVCADESRDPLVRNARRLVATGAATPDGLRAIVAQTRDAVQATAERAAATPKLTTRVQVMAPLAPYREARARVEACARLDDAQRAEHFGPDLPERASAPPRRTMAAHINAALRDEMLRRPEVVVFGEDVGRKGGVYHVTAGLQRAFGSGRVFDTLLDETTILGLAQGAGLLGLLPVPEIQYLAYVHNALDQLRGEACSLSFFSSGQFANPMVVRVAGLAYQKGFGGHFHNDNAVGALRDIPGLALAVPARGDDAARLLRGALAMARTDGRVVVFLEPIALYHEKDLHSPGDGGWLSDYPPPGSALLPGEVGTYNPDARDLLIATYGNGVRMALRVARRLLDEHDLGVRVLDLRWLNPLPFEAIREHAAECGRVLVADEARATGGGVADAIVADLVEQGFRGPLATVRSADSYVPLGPAAGTVLLSEGDIHNAAMALAKA
ncbi:MAG: thiamine pyrophosphate-dependent enzyme [Actinomycetota bacterium]|nr:MFS transporter [Euzebyaceae bacterium]MDQ3528756.1 thiamine pyrophosphate-dependent enzyme [Actinomycetota bacterium]